MTDARVSPTGRRLGLLLLGYLGVVVAVIVFAPFQFTAPSTERVLLTPSGAEAMRDVLLNVALFVPLGFLLERTARGRLRVWQVVGIGMAISLGIEVTQLFLPVRWTTATDVLANATGAASGAATSTILRRRLGASESLAGRLFLDLPLLGICWLLMPMLWVSALQGPLVPLLCLMAAGGFAIAGAGRSNAARERLPAGVLWPLVLGWSVTATLPGIVAKPSWMLAGIMTAFAACLMGDALWRDGHGSDRRVEPRAVAAVVLALLPWFVIRGLLDPFANNGMHIREAILEWLALACGFTLLGYALAEWRGRSSRPWPVSALIPMVLGAVVSLPLGRGRPAVMVAAAVIAAFGALLFKAQRDHIVATRTQ